MRCLLSIFLIAFFVPAFGQTIVKGFVSNENGEPLIGVLVEYSNPNAKTNDATTNIPVIKRFGATTDENGFYEINIQPGSHQLTFTYLGYKSQEQKIEVEDKLITLNVVLSELPHELGLVVVGESRYEKKLEESTVSVEIVHPQMIETSNTTSLDQLVRRMVGVQVMDGQVNIRSGAGFAYGAGSRVMFVVDEQPLLSAELSDIKWNFVPIENAGQIEIIKGASSVLYGSGALNGVINVKTAFPTDVPSAEVTVYSSFYDAPKTPERRWWSGIDQAPFVHGVYFSKREKLTKNFDFVLGGNMHYDKNILKGADEVRMRLNLNTRHRPESTDGNFFYGVNANIMYHEQTTFFLWQDGANNSFVHIDTNYVEDRYTSFTIDPYATYFDVYENKHSLKARYFGIVNNNHQFRAANGNTGVFNLEYQFQRKFSPGWVLTGGLLGQNFRANSTLFVHDRDVIGDIPDSFRDLQSGYSTAAYAQIEGRISDKLNWSLGSRWEGFWIDSTLNTTFPVFKGGLNFKISNNNFLRASYGQGYRVPSLAERYTNRFIIDGISVLPNPELLPESGWNAEIGYKHSNKIGSWKGYADIALFWMEYKNMTEFSFGIFPPDVIPPGLSQFDYIGFKSINVSSARIAGFETSLSTEGKIGQLPIRLYTGYTFTYPGDLERDTALIPVGAYLDSLSSAFLNGVGEQARNSILKYRSLHTFRLDAEVEYKGFNLGFAANYNSFQVALDDLFTEGSPWGVIVQQLVPGLVEGISGFREENPNGSWIFDFRFGYRFNKKHRLNLAINNLLNEEYSMRVAKMNPTRTVSLKYTRTF